MVPSFGVGMLMIARRDQSPFKGITFGPKHVHAATHWENASHDTLGFVLSMVSYNFNRKMRPVLLPQPGAELGISLRMTSSTRFAASTVLRRISNSCDCMLLTSASLIQLISCFVAPFS